MKEKILIALNSGEDLILQGVINLHPDPQYPRTGKMVQPGCKRSERDKRKRKAVILELA